MVIFQYNLIFVDELQLQDEMIDNSLDTIYIIKRDHSYLKDRYIECSDWTTLSGQNARYHTVLSLQESIHNFSWALEIKDVVVLCWDSDKREISYIKNKYYTPKRLQFWIFHTFFPLILEEEKIYHILHVGAVEIDGKAILFSAPSFGGKSTLTEYFLNRGHRLLSDDSLAIEKIDGIYYAIPSYPFSRPYRELETLGLYRENFVKYPKVISAIFQLNRSKPDSNIGVSSINGVEKFKTLYMSSFINFSSFKADRYRYYSDMANSIDIYKIDIPWNRERLSEVYREIVISI